MGSRKGWQPGRGWMSDETFTPAWSRVTSGSREEEEGLARPECGLKVREGKAWSCGRHGTLWGRGAPLGCWPKKEAAVGRTHGEHEGTRSTQADPGPSEPQALAEYAAPDPGWCI